ncbi:MAG: bifunctional oligoribonuclease/PAP phosphatase NrnA [Candidatus Omnitrophica bacterium]|nr:bifunctional oligoribonuclease/PAP phosphatase NrnA [Candidatus Omnitrophota bacterium]
MDKQSFDGLIRSLKERDNFLIAAHVNPEGDSIGSQLALQRVLEGAGKRTAIVNNDPVPGNLMFLPGSGRVLSALPDGFRPEVFCVVDCPVEQRTGRVRTFVTPEIHRINIDHHVSNEYFADINWVEPGMSSVGEMIYHIAEALGMVVDEELAASIYTAMVTDTGMFNYDNTTGETHVIAGKLIEAGIRPRTMHREIFEKKDPVDLRVLGRVLSALRLHAGGRVASITLTKEMLMEEGVRGVSTDEFINYPRSIKGVEVSVFFKEAPEAPDRVNISFRSSGDIDVNKLASSLGGGGHPAAAGCLFHGSLEEAEQDVIQRTVDFCE